MSEAPPAVRFRRALLAHMGGDVAGAEAQYRGLADDPQLGGAARGYLIRLLEHNHRWSEALAERRAAVAAQPDHAGFRADLGLALLGLGHYAEAWPLLESRAELSAGIVRPTLPFAEWDGGPIRSIVLWDEQGAGDTIQFGRFIPELVERGVQVSVVVRESLVRLFGSFGVEVIKATDGVRVPRSDAWAMLPSLPGRLGVTLETIPRAGGYMSAPDDARADWAARLRRPPRIGVVTHGNRTHANDTHRSLSDEAAAFLLSLPDAVSLLPAGPLPLKDFADTAAVIEQLSLVITVDTSVAHLAGALGKPCWLLLPYIGVDWRWLRDGRTDSPWYESLRLYRQPAPGDWATPLRAVAQDLAGFFAPKG